MANAAKGWLRQAQYDEACRRIEKLEAALRVIAAQTSGIPGSTNRADCMAALASATLRSCGCTKA